VRAAGLTVALTFESLVLPAARTTRSPGSVSLTDHDQGKVALSLWQGSWIAGLLVGALVWGMILWAVIFHRKRGTRCQSRPATTCRSRSCTRRCRSC